MVAIKRWVRPVGGVKQLERKNYDPRIGTEIFIYDSCDS